MRVKTGIVFGMLLAASASLAQWQPVKTVASAPWDGKYPGSSQPFFFDATISNGYLFVAAGKGLYVAEAWSGIGRGYWYGSTYAPTWLESDQKWYVTDVATPPGEDDVAVTASSGNGIIVWDTSTKGAAPAHYQDLAGGEATGVYALTSGGSDYAYLAMSDGLRIYDLTAARQFTGCRDVSSAGELCCPGVYQGRAGTGLATRVDGVGRWMAVASPSGWQLYDVTFPLHPVLQTTRSPASDIAATIGGGSTIIASVGGPLTLSSVSASGIVTALSTWSAPGGVALQRVSASQAPFGPALWVSGTSGGVTYEAVLDISTPSAPQVVGDPAYWTQRRATQNAKSPPPDYTVHGHGTWFGPWLYVSSQELLDAARYGGGGSPSKPPDDDADTPVVRLPSACAPPPPPSDDDDDVVPEPPLPTFQACFEVGPAIAGQPATITDCSTGDPLRYEFDFEGDAVVDHASKSPATEHTWETAGTYSPTLRTLSPGLRSLTSREIAVLEPGVPSPPMTLDCRCEEVATVTEASTGRTIITLRCECEETP